MAQFLTNIEREQLALACTYLGKLRTGGNLYDPDYVAGDEYKDRVMYATRRRVERKNYYNLDYEPADIPYIIPYLTGKTRFNALIDFRSIHFSYLVPKIRIFKVYTDEALGETAEVEIVFPTNRPGGEDEIVGVSPFLLSSAGIKDFEAIFQGVNEAEVENNIRCKLKLFFSNLYELSKRHQIKGDDLRRDVGQIVEANAGFGTGVRKMVRDHLGIPLDQAEIMSRATQWSYLDIFTPPMTSWRLYRTSEADGKSFYYGEDYKIRAVFGWSVPPNYGKVFDLTSEMVEEVKRLIEGVNYSLILNLTTHTIDFSQEGVITIDGEFIGAVEQQMFSPNKSIFAVSETKKRRGGFFGGIFSRDEEEVQVSNLLRIQRHEEQAKFLHDLIEGGFYGDEMLTKAREALVAIETNLKFLRDVYQGNSFYDFYLRVIKRSSNGRGFEFQGNPARGRGYDAGDTVYGEYNWQVEGDAEEQKVSNFQEVQRGEGGRVEVPISQIKTILFNKEMLRDGPEAEIFIEHMKKIIGLHTERESNQIVKASDIPANIVELLKQPGPNMLGGVLFESAKLSARQAASVKAVANSYGDFDEVEPSLDQDEQEKQRGEAKQARDNIVTKMLEFIEGDTIDDALAKDESAPRAKLLTELEATPVPFLTIGEVLDTVLDAMSKKNDPKVLLGTVMIHDTVGAAEGAGDGGEGNMRIWHAPIEDLPISFSVFYRWYMENIIAREKYNYSVGDFLSTGIRQLVALSLRNLEHVGFKGINTASVSKFSFSLPKPVAEKIFKLCPAGRGGSTKGNNYIPLGEIRAITDAMSNTDIDLSESVEIIYVAGRPVQQIFDLVGNRAEDQERGIKHFYIGAPGDILKAAEFQRDNMPGFRESKIRQATEEGVESQLSLISEPYLLTLRLVGNSLFYPGMRVYFNPTIMGSVTESDFTLPLEGYYLIYEVKDYVTSGKFETELKCRFEALAAGGERRPVHGKFDYKTYFNVETPAEWAHRLGAVGAPGEPVSEQWVPQVQVMR